jgi:hypothetical protein
VAAAATFVRASDLDQAVDVHVGLRMARVAPIAQAASF